MDIEIKAQHLSPCSLHVGYRAWHSMQIKNLAFDSKGFLAELHYITQSLYSLRLKITDLARL